MHFGSDNHSAASPVVLDALCRANHGWAGAYGNDEWTARACAELSRVFEREVAVFFVPTGTAANALALAAAVRPWQSILCHDQAHIRTDESTAVELHTGGARVVGISGRDGKLTATHLEAYFRDVGTEDVPHHIRPGALSLSQQSELGLVYSPEELRALCDAARRFGLVVHVDGARFANAVAATGRAPADLSWRAGVDVLSLGATKNGCLAVEAIVVFSPALAEHLPFLRKRGGHLLSKNRLFAAQLGAWLERDHWLDLARHANEHGRQLACELAALPGVRLAWPTDGNEVFAIMPGWLLDALRGEGATLYDWYRGAIPPHEALADGELLVRLVTSFASEDQHRQDLLAAAWRAIGAHRP